MTLSGRPDAIVVGAGIIGAACALELARAGVRVLVLDAGAAGGGTTAAAMGHLVVMDDSEAQLALTAYSLGLWRALAPELPPECELDPCGTLWIAADEGQLEALHAKLAYYSSHGVAAEVLDAFALARLEPGLRAPLAGALLVPGDSVVYPPGAAKYLLDESCRAGATFLGGTAVQRILPGEVLVSGRTLEAPIVVNAAGHAAASLTPGLPIVPRKGHLAITDRYRGFCRHQLVELGYLRSAHEMSAQSVAFNVQPRRTGQLLIGSSRELVGEDASTNRTIVARMLRRAVEFMPGLASASVLRIWTGFRPATPDKLPLIGRWEDTGGATEATGATGATGATAATGATGAEGLWIAAGHEGLGITTSLGTARLLADLVTGRPPAIDPLPYDPRRTLAALQSDARDS